MAHTIIELLQLGISPIAPLLWLWTDADGSTQRWDMKCPVEAKVNLAVIEDMLADRIWKDVSWHEANSGLEHGEPDLPVAQRVAKQLYAEGKADEARALGCIVCHGSWRGARANPHRPDLALCLRCGASSRHATPCLLRMQRQ